MVSGTVAMAGLPAYIGWGDHPLSAFAIYALVAGLALAVDLAPVK